MPYQEDLFSSLIPPRYLIHSTTGRVSNFIEYSFLIVLLEVAPGSVILHLNFFPKSGGYYQTKQLQKSIILDSVILCIDGTLITLVGRCRHGCGASSGPGRILDVISRFSNSLVDRGPSFCEEHPHKKPNITASSDNGCISVQLHGLPNFPHPFS